MRRMLFFDIDGTLVNSRDRTIPDSTGRAIRLARAAGHLVYVNSGRPWCGVDPRVKAMGFHGFVCGKLSRMPSERQAYTQGAAHSDHGKGPGQTSRPVSYTHLTLPTKLEV